MIIVIKTIITSNHYKLFVRFCNSETVFLLLTIGTIEIFDKNFLYLITDSTPEMYFKV